MTIGEAEFARASCDRNRQGAEERQKRERVDASPACAGVLRTAAEHSILILVVWRSRAAWRPLGDFTLVKASFGATTV